MRCFRALIGAWPPARPPNFRDPPKRARAPGIAAMGIFDKIGDKIEASNQKIADSFDKLGDKIEASNDRIAGTLKRVGSGIKDAVDLTPDPPEPPKPAPQPTKVQLVQQLYEGGVAQRQGLAHPYTLAPEHMERIRGAATSSTGGLVHWAGSARPWKKVAGVLWGMLLLWVLWDVARMGFGAVRLVWWAGSSAVGAVARRGQVPAGPPIAAGQPPQ
ncbi:hypothetical protein DFJ74DRAFT_499737 [Hyaloraphidium curvatum]|nr:hypothetical protein DFJ74DRAFT_499737 [Hyaloraphidium curvatum]